LRLLVFKLVGHRCQIFIYQSIEIIHSKIIHFCLTCCRFSLVPFVVLALFLVVLAAVFIFVAHRLAVFAFLLFATAVAVTFQSRQLFNQNESLTF